MKNSEVEKPKMNGGIIKRGKGYAIKISTGKDPSTGKYGCKWYSAPTLKEAKRKQREIMTQLDNGIYIEPQKLTVADHLRRWLIEYAKPKLSPRGFERYRDLVGQHFIPAFGKLRLVDLRAEHIQKHYQDIQDMGLSPATVRYHHAVLHKALATAIKRGLLVRNAADGADIPSLGLQQFDTWNEDEVNQFLEAAKDSPYHALFFTALYTGMRRSELLALHWGDVDLLGLQISVNSSLHHLKDGNYVYTPTKSKSSKRTLSLTPDNALLLGQYRKQQQVIYKSLGAQLTDADPVFSTIKGKPFRPNSVTRAWVTMTHKAEVKPIRFHDARHTHATLMLNAGIHPKIVQERLGHHSITITLDRYSHVVKNIQQAAARRFDELLSPAPVATVINDTVSGS